MSEIILAVGAVIEDKDGRILLVKHKPERGGYWQGKWICPGGRLEWGETLEEGARREVKEETGLDVTIGRQIIPFERIVRQGRKTTLHVVYIDFIARVVGGEFAPASDVGEGRWVTRSEMRGMWGELHEDTQRLMKLAGVI
ncbi:MAG: NUDIX domain-containing protein [Dehalococcoidia bacterium]